MNADNNQQTYFDFLPRYQKAKWMFTCLCLSCLRIMEIPAGIFLQGDPVCFCGSHNISAAHYPRLIMEELQEWTQTEPLTLDGDDRVIVSWSKKDGAVFERKES